MEDQGYINRFVDVHAKVKAFKDRIRQSNETDADRRQEKSAREAGEIVDKEPASS